jgi:predicted RNA-binding protein with PIN domain
VVDGMNVIGSRPDGWWRDRDGAVRRLLGKLQALVRADGDDVTLVLDGRPLHDVAEGEHDGVHVLYAARRGRDAADDRIVTLLGTLDSPAEVHVVTSDRALAQRARDLGATVTGAGSLLERLDRGAS